MLELASYLNLILSFIGAALYIRNGIRCQTRHWKIYKFMTAANLLIIATVYFLFIIKVNVDHIVLRLNTTLIILLIITNAILGRSRYGKRY